MIETWIDLYGEGALLLTAGALVGLVFGAVAQHSRYCLRAATVEVADGQIGPRLSCRCKRRSRWVGWLSARRANWR